jgi:uncharacterized membrane protein YkoI
MNKLKKILIAVAVLAAAALGGAALAGATGGGDNENALTGSTLDRASQAALAKTGGGKVTGSERDGENGATYEIEVTKDGKQVDVRLDDQFSVLVVEGDDEDQGEEQGEEQGAGDEKLTGATLDRASKAALAKTGGGKVTGAERDTEHGGTYEIEVTKADGSQVDVRLDSQLKVVMVEPDHED